MYSTQQRSFLLKLARESIKSRLEAKPTPQIEESQIDKELKEIRGVFVTLTINGNLKGCIGHIEPVQELYKDVIQNSMAAAFDDPRFSPLTANELKSVIIEISVLSPPQPLLYKDADDLLQKLTPGRDGVVIKKGFYRATYLPQVWEDLPDKENFLASLCQKAGMDENEWRQGELEVETYTVEMFEEE